MIKTSSRSSRSSLARNTRNTLPLSGSLSLIFSKSSLLSLFPLVHISLCSHLCEYDNSELPSFISQIHLANLLSAPSPPHLLPTQQRSHSLMRFSTPPPSPAKAAILVLQPTSSRALTLARNCTSLCDLQPRLSTSPASPRKRPSSASPRAPVLHLSGASSKNVPP